MGRMGLDRAGRDPAGSDPTGQDGIRVNWSEPGRIRPEGIRLNPSGWDQSQIKLGRMGQTGQDWTQTDPTELGRMRQNRREWDQIQRTAALRLGFGVIPEPLQMESAGVCSWGGLASLTMEQGSESHRDPPGRAGAGWIPPVPLLSWSGVCPGRACIPQASIGISPVPEVVLHLNVLKSAPGTWFSSAPLLLYIFICIFPYIHPEV